MKNVTPKEIITYTLALIAAILASVFGWKIYQKYLAANGKTTGDDSDKAKGDAVSKVVVDKSKLRKNEAYYMTVADGIYKITLGNFVFGGATLEDFNTVKAMLNILTPQELNQVFVDFGARQETNFLITFGRTYTLTEAIQKKFKVGSDYTKQLQVIFKNTKLW